MLLWLSSIARLFSTSKILRTFAKLSSCVFLNFVWSNKTNKLSLSSRVLTRLCISKKIDCFRNSGIPISHMSAVDLSLSTNLLHFSFLERTNIFLLFIQLILTTLKNMFWLWKLPESWKQEKNNIRICPLCDHVIELSSLFIWELK